jgi:DNA-binding IclR family transcriptional regulator
MFPPGPQYRALRERETEVGAELRDLAQRLRDRMGKRTDG